MAEGTRALCPLGVLLALQWGQPGIRGQSRLDPAVSGAALGAGRQHQKCWNPGAEPSQPPVGCAGKVGAATGREGGDGVGGRWRRWTKGWRRKQGLRDTEMRSSWKQMCVEEVGLGWEWRKSGWMRWDGGDGGGGQRWKRWRWKQGQVQGEEEGGGD